MQSPEWNEEGYEVDEEEKEKLQRKFDLISHDWHFKQKYFQGTLSEDEEEEEPPADEGEPSVDEEEPSADKEEPSADEEKDKKVRFA